MEVSGIKINRLILLVHNITWVRAYLAVPYRSGLPHREVIFQNLVTMIQSAPQRTR